MKSVLDVKHLSVSHYEKKQLKPIIKDVSFSVAPGKCLGILGESGSGKSLSIRAITGLLDKNFKVSGEAIFNDLDLLQVGSKTLRALRGSQISMILQNPMTSFDPLYRIEDQIKETLLAHSSIKKDILYQKALDTLKLLRIKAPEDVLRKYPHQLSGGMLQRVMIGLAIVLEPHLIIADEPTTALDTITQHYIIEEFLRIKKERQTTMIFISHDLGVLSRIADEVIVMHEGKAIESGDLSVVFKNPQDPYTQRLINERLLIMKQFKNALEGKERHLLC